MADWKLIHATRLAGQRALVTGGAGFIGSHLVEALATLGVQVVVLDDLSGGSAPNLDVARSAGDVELVEGSVLDRRLVERCAQDCQVIFHQAGLASVPRSVEQPIHFHEVNTTGTLYVLEAARVVRARRVIFAASSSAYGDAPEQPKNEIMPPLPRSPYAATKIAGEAMLRAYGASYELDAVSLRYFNIFGPRQNANSAYAAVIAAFASSLLDDKPPVIFGDGSQSRDFTYVDNVVHANLLAMRQAKPLDGEVINVASGRSVTVTALAAEMAEQLGRGNLRPVYRPARAGDVKHSLADLTRARELLGYEPIVSFEEGLKLAVDWYARTHGSVGK